MSDVKITDNSDKLLKELQRKQLEFVALGGQMIRTEMISRCRKKTGNLANGTVTESFVQNGIATSETGPTAFYAVYIERGTGIYATGGGGRQTPWWYMTPDGKWFFTHGGKAQPFAEPGFQAAKPKINQLSQRLLKV